jgi:integrase/recombinase XerD
MSYKTHPRPHAPTQDRIDNPLGAALIEFLTWSETTAMAMKTVRQRRRSIRRFILWAQERGLTRPEEITLPILERYQRHLYHYRKPDGEPLAFASQYAELNPLRAFFKWLTRSRYIHTNPASELAMPKVVPRLPRYVLTVAEVERILGTPDVTSLLGIRDRTIMEVLYSSAVRRNELIHLMVHDVDHQRGSVFVRAGKGGHDRLVPLGARACQWVAKYLLDVRPEFQVGLDHGRLFLTQHGDPIHEYTLGEAVKGYIAKAGVIAPGSCHLFRHACATHMLENGADTRYIQVLLGHSDLSTTQIYTRVSVTKLKAVHDLTHPARLKKPGDDNASAVASDIAAQG